MLVHMTHTGGLQGPNKEFNESDDCQVMSGCPKKVNDTELSQRMEEQWLKLPWVGGDGLRATKA
jgi:hypothetical protein